MQRLSIEPRRDWQAAVERVGLSFHTLDDGSPYWDESGYYRFGADEIDTLERVTGELMDRCLEAGQWMVDHNAFASFGITEPWVGLIREAWERDEPQLLGRFDLCWGGAGGPPPKLLEFNADTPTALIEAAVAQWYWLQERMSGEDQFNSLHERLVRRWGELKISPGLVHFACVRGSAEDHMNVTYLRDTAMQAGLPTEFLFVEDIGARDNREFVDLRNRRINTIFKLYPWEWLTRDQFGALIPTAGTRFIEPIWKMLFSNKALLAVLWHLFPGHPNLLPTAFEPEKLPAGSARVRKPLLGREGANITITAADGTILAENDGPYGDGTFLYQAFQPLPDFGGRRPVIGSWVIGGEAAGIGIRESDDLITDNRSRFVPHAFGAR